MLNRKKVIKPKKVILIIVGLVILILLVVSSVFWWKRGKSTTRPAKKTDEPKPNVPKPNQSPNPLFSELKSDILAELESIKRAVTTNKVDEVLGLGYKAGRDGAILRNNNQKKVLPTELETADYEEIISLITQKRDLGRDKNIELNKEVDKKLADHSDLFYWPVTVSKTPNMRDWYAWRLSAKENGKDYNLLILRDHPATANISFADCQFYQITGVDNLPMVPSPFDKTRIYKIVKLSDQITIKHYKP
ncbi:MAG: hypothetical protein MRERV_18c026 [Mycoplasmataceae bacterium RV_VA103A]|nr:MAG: hypothetical protein MRERV_18c026 [Mycoplasmataceae bacterium RV_VA103A]